MRVIDNGRLPDGVHVQLESWAEPSSSLVIAAYPMAQRTDGAWIKGGHPFRLHIGSNQYAGYTDEMVIADYHALLSGKKSLCDLSEHFYNGEKDKWHLGMDTDYRP